MRHSWRTATVAGGYCAVMEGARAVTGDGVGARDREETPMALQRPINQRLVSVFLLGWVLFTFPLLSLFNSAQLALGVPIFYVYLFAVWALFIGMLALAVERRG